MLRKSRAVLWAYKRRSFVNHSAWNEHEVPLLICIQRPRIFHTLSYLHNNSIRTLNDDNAPSVGSLYITYIHDGQ
jgi:hypothetical protein